MAKGHENLIPFNELTEAEQRKLAKKGGIASGKARKEKRMLKDILEEALSKGTETDNEYVNITLALIKEAKKGNTKAYEVIRDTLGQKMPDKLEVSKPIDDTIKEVDEYLCQKN